MYWFLIRSIVSAVLGSQFYKWYATTKIGIYFQNRIDQFMEYISQKYDIEIMKKQSKFEKDYPLMMKRIEALEELFSKVSANSLILFFSSIYQTTSSSSVS